MSTKNINNTVVKIIKSEGCFTYDNDDVLIVLNSKDKSVSNIKNKSKKQDEKQNKKYDYEKIELEKLKDYIKEKTIIVEYLKKKLEKEKKKLEGLKYDLEELELLNIKEE